MMLSAPLAERMVNINVGAIALGHPFGQTGARTTTTAIHTLQERDEQGAPTVIVGRVLSGMYVAGDGYALSSGRSAASISASSAT
ncbi:MAG: hypothetical protein ACTIJ6_04930 [Leucobacter sp.]